MNDGQSVLSSSTSRRATAGYGAGSWPDLVTIEARRGASTDKAQRLRQVAENRASERSRRDQWSFAKGVELQEFAIQAHVDRTGIDTLRNLIDNSTNEQPLQQFFEHHREILAALLSGRTRFLISRVSLSGKYVPDFLLADVDSRGIRWLYVEIETPTSTVTMKNDNILEKHARKGVSQIKEWREWIQDNLSLARRSRTDGGLGLIDIRPQSDGLVLVGRQAHLLPNSGNVRSSEWENSRIQVQTYDWLVERLEGIARFSGLPVLSPYTIKPGEAEF